MKKIWLIMIGVSFLCIPVFCTSQGDLQNDVIIHMCSVLPDQYINCAIGSLVMIYGAFDIYNYLQHQHTKQEHRKDYFGSSSDDDRSDEDLEGHMFNFKRHAFGKISEDHSDDTLYDEAYQYDLENQHDLHDWINGMNYQCKELSIPTSSRAIPGVRNYNKKYITFSL